MKRKSINDAGSRLLDFFTGRTDYPDGDPAVVIASAHFDDESIGLGGQIFRMKNIVFVHTTDSSPLNMRDAAMNGCLTVREYSAVRYNEFCSAMNIAGHRMPAAVEFGIPDQQSSYRLKDIASDMFDLIVNLRPEVIITHPFEGGHPDHDACAFAVHTAVGMLRQKQIPSPSILEFASYFAKDDKMAVCDFLPYEGFEKHEVLLPEKSLDIKQNMLACYKTQQHVIRYFPAEKECYRRAPQYDFTRPPHSGKLYYENFDWGIGSKEWTEQAVKSQNELRRLM